MRRSHRLALSALAALAVLVAAGRLATSAAAREEHVHAAAPSLHADDAAIANALRDAAHAGSAAAGETDGMTANSSRSGRVAPLADAAGANRQPVDRFAAGAAIALDDPQTALGAAVVVSGRDAGAPRAIELWRIAGARAVRVATGISEADGALALPPVVLPAVAVTLVAAPRGEGADSPNASAPVVASRDPSAPQLVAVDAAQADALVVTVEPAETDGAIVVARASQQEIGRAAVVAGADASRAPVAIAVALMPDDTEILVAQEVSDGRRSPWRRVAIARQPQGE